jgi:SAM-dependent methyltransferase
LAGDPLMLEGMFAFARSLLFLAPAALILAAPGETAQAQLPPAGDPPFVPTPERVVEEMLALARVGPGDTVYDLGSGDGRAVIAAARTGARGIGIEYDAALVTLSKAAAERAGVTDRVEFLHQDLFASDFGSATVVFLYLGADFNLRLRPRLLADLRPGTRVVSHAFHMGDWEPDSTVTIGTGAGRATLFSWTVPTGTDGFWSLEVDGTQPVTLEILQAFQRLSGTVRAEGADWPILAGRVAGEAVEFAIPVRSSGGPALWFRGRVIDGRIRGVVEGPAPWGGRRWQAVRLNDPTRAPLP